MNKETFSTTIFFKPGTAKPHKYNNVTNLEKLANYCQQFGEVYYINIYSQKTKQFLKRLWIKQFKQ